MVRGRRWCFVAVSLAVTAIAGCALEPPGEFSAPAEPQPVARRAAVTTSTVAPTTTTVAAPALRVSAPVIPSPWSSFAGEVYGPRFAIAHARAGGIPVAPILGGLPIASLSPLTRVGAPRVALVVSETPEWLQVLLPLRPNGSVGWVRRSDVDVTYTSLRVEIDRAAHRLRAFDGDALFLDEAVAVGRHTTPTPAGQFFVTELLRPPNPNGAYGPYAFTLSAYSPVYQRFGSGDGAVGLHGTNEPRHLGSDASHGCVRLGNDAIRRLAALLPLGTPVVIR